MNIWKLVTALLIFNVPLLAQINNTNLIERNELKKLPEGGLSNIDQLDGAYYLDEQENNLSQKMVKFDFELIGTSIEPNACNSNNPYRVLQYVQRGDDTIPSGIPLEFLFIFSEDTLRQEVVNNFQIFPGVSLIDINRIEIPQSLDYKNEIEVKINFIGDLNDTNDYAETIYFTAETMSNGDIETYESWPEDRGKYILIDDDGSSEISTITIENDNWLAFVPDREEYEGYTGDDIDWLFDSNSIRRIGQEICFSTSNMDDPVLRFEYIPFYSEEIVELPFGQTNLFKIFIEINGDITTSEVFHSYEEGVEHFFEYDLPKSSGSLDLFNVLLFGNLNDFENSNYENGDFSFFNNFRIEERVVSSSSNQKISDFVNVHPNPSYTEVKFEFSKESSYNLTIFSSDGKIIHQKSSQSDHYTFQKNDLLGIYFYVLTLNDKVTKSGKLVFVE